MRAETEFLNLVVDAQVLLYVGVRYRDICLRLVIIVIRYEILDGVGREEGLELSVELGGQGLVVAEDERRALQTFDYAGHGEGLSRARDTQESDVRHAFGQGRAELVDGLRLVAGGLVCRF